MPIAAFICVRRHIAGTFLDIPLDLTCQDGFNSHGLIGLLPQAVFGMAEVTPKPPNREVSVAGQISRTQQWQVVGPGHVWAPRRQQKS